MPRPRSIASGGLRAPSLLLTLAPTSQMSSTGSSVRSTSCTSLGFRFCAESSSRQNPSSQAAGGFSRKETPLDSASGRTSPAAASIHTGSGSSIATDEINFNGDFAALSLLVPPSTSVLCTPLVCFPSANLELPASRTTSKTKKNMGAFLMNKQTDWVSSNKESNVHGVQHCPRTYGGSECNSGRSSGYTDEIELVRLTCCHCSSLGLVSPEKMENFRYT